jgi:hypothetical protein
MRMRIQRLVVVVMALLPEVCAAQATLNNDQFHAGFSDSGIASVKRAQDKYDTDGVESGLSRMAGACVLRFGGAITGERGTRVTH